MPPSIKFSLSIFICLPHLVLNGCRLTNFFRILLCQIYTLNTLITTFLLRNLMCMLCLFDRQAYRALETILYAQLSLIKLMVILITVLKFQEASQSLSEL